LGSSCSWFLANATHLEVFWVNKNVFFGRISWDVERKVLAGDFLVGLVWFVNGGGDRGVYNASLRKKLHRGKSGIFVLKRGKFGVEIVELVG